jgi:hypothetical protein
MNTAQQTAKSPWKTVARFALVNGILFATFSVLWVVDRSDVISYVVFPWGCLAGFFFASYCLLRRRVALPIVFSAFLSVLFSGVLFLFIAFFLAPTYDPYF